MADPVRCAIYTRKSTEEGLEQEFNCLDAQREACAAYILSQRHEGWTLLPSVYDDGGFSGGNMERPGAAAAAGRCRRGQDRRHRRLQGRPADPQRWPTSPRSSRCSTRAASLRLGHAGVQHHHQHGPADAQRAAVLRPVRARGHRRAHPRQDRRLQGARACGWAAPCRLATTSSTASWSSTTSRPSRSATSCAPISKLGSVRALTEKLAAAGYRTK